MESTNNKNAFVSSLLGGVHSVLGAPGIKQVIDIGNLASLVGKHNGAWEIGLPGIAAVKAPSMMQEPLSRASHWFRSNVPYKYQNAWNKSQDIIGHAFNVDLASQLLFRGGKSFDPDPTKMSEGALNARYKNIINRANSIMKI